MSARRIMFITDGLPWLRIENDEITERGNGFGPQERTQEVLVVIPPADAVALHWIDLPGLAPAQARSAARLVGLEQTILTADQAFVACSDFDLPNGQRIIGITEHALIARWIEVYDPDVILPSPLLLPAPREGFVCGDLGHEVVVRGIDTGFAYDKLLADVIMGDGAMTRLDRATLERSIVQATAEPELSLRQGEFGRSTPWLLDRRWFARVGIAAALLALLTLMIPIIDIIRLNQASATLEDTSISLAQAALGEAVPPAEAVAALNARLAKLRGGGSGFAATAGATIQSIEATANTEITKMAFGSDGVLHVTVRASNIDEFGALQSRMRALGLVVISGPVNPSQGQPLIDLQVSGR